MGFWMGGSIPSRECKDLRKMVRFSFTIQWTTYA